MCQSCGAGIYKNCENENRSFMPLEAVVPILKIGLCSLRLRESVVPQ